MWCSADTHLQNAINVVWGEMLAEQELRCTKKKVKEDGKELRKSEAYLPLD